MNPATPQDNPLTRRAYLLWMGAALSACGGGGSGLTSLLPGTGGTGGPVYAQGSISGFGSVIVNGITFDDSQASVKLNGTMVQARELQLGMVAGVQGQRNATNASLGTAQAIDVWSIAQGPVSRLAGDTFEVLGMTFKTDSNTAFGGSSLAFPLLVNQTVAVWGLQMDAAATQWKATRVDLAPNSAQRVLTGRIQREDEHHASLNGLKLSGDAVEALATGTVARLQGTLSPDNALNVNAVELLNAAVATGATGTVELEGVVTGVLQGGRFMLGSIIVDASNPALAVVTSQLVVGQEVEVYGTWASGVLVATQLVLESEGSKNIEIKAAIEQFSSVADFVVRGQRCNAAMAKFSGGQATDLALGKKVKVKGTLATSVLMVSKLEFD